MVWLLFAQKRLQNAEVELSSGSKWLDSSHPIADSYSWRMLCAQSERSHDPYRNNKPIPHLSLSLAVVMQMLEDSEHVLKTARIASLASAIAGVANLLATNFRVLASWEQHSAGVLRHRHERPPPFAPTNLSLLLLARTRSYRCKHSTENKGQTIGVEPSLLWRKHVGWLARLKIVSTHILFYLFYLYFARRAFWDSNLTWETAQHTTSLKSRSLVSHNSVSSIDKSSSIVYPSLFSVYF